MINNFSLYSLIFLCLSLPFDSAAKLNNDYPMINLTLGEISLFDDKPMKANRYGIEYRGKKITKWSIIPAFGYSWNINGTKYLYNDLKKDWLIGSNLVFTLSLGTGLFDNNKNLDLGHTIEFRTGLELTYRFKHGYRFGIAAYHLSNSRLSNFNPGTESVAVSFLAPLEELFDK